MTINNWKAFAKTWHIIVKSRKCQGILTYYIFKNAQLKERKKSEMA